MREKREKVNKARHKPGTSSNPQDQVFVVNFNDEYYLDQDFTGDINKLRESLEKVESRGGTALYDAVVASADHLAKNAKLSKKCCSWSPTAKITPAANRRASGASPAGRKWADGLRDWPVRR